MINASPIPQRHVLLLKDLPRHPGNLLDSDEALKSATRTLPGSNIDIDISVDLTICRYRYRQYRYICSKSIDTKHIQWSKHL